MDTPPPASIFSRFWPPFAALISGVALSFCYPRWNQSGLVWIALAPLLVALWFSNPPFRTVPKRGPAKRLRSTAGWRGFKLAWLAGFAFFCLNLSWLLSLKDITGSSVPGTLGVLSLSAYLALFFAFWGAFATTVGRIKVDRLFRGPTTLESLVAKRANKQSTKRSTFTPLSEKPHTSTIGAMFLSSGESLRAAFLCAAAWCGLEWLRGYLFTGFGWNGLGVALHGNIVLIQICDIVGVTGLSFLIIFCLCVGTATVRRFMLEVGNGRARPHLDFAAAITLVILVFFYGMDRSPTAKITPSSPPTPGTTELKVLLVQAFIPTQEKFNPDHAGEIYDTHIAYSVNAPRYDLVVWPESALPYPYFHHENKSKLDPFLAGGDFSLLAGANLFDLADLQNLPSPDSIPPIFNAAVLVQGDLMNDPQIYKKIHLVPFGEYVPIPVLFSWVKEWIPGDFESGTSSDPLYLEKPGVHISPLICFEDTIGRVARHAVRPGKPQVLVNITNDGWFGTSAESELHLANALFRCVELRRPMVRAANTGVTCVIDKFGSFLDPTNGSQRILKSDDGTSTFVSNAFPATLVLENDPPITFYAQFGDIFSISLGLIALGFFLLPVFRRQSKT